MGFLYKSTTIFLFLILHEVSRNARVSPVLHLHGETVATGFSVVGEWGKVWFIVNLIVGCSSLISIRNLCRFSNVPV